MKNSIYFFVFFVKMFYFKARSDDSRKAESVSGSSITLTESNVGTFVEQGEQTTWEIKITKITP